MMASRRKNSRTRWVAALVSLLALFAWFRYPEARKPLSGAIFKVFSSFDDTASPSDRVVVVAMEETGLPGQGPGPWRARDFAQLLRLIADAKPAILGVNFEVEENYSLRDKAFLAQVLSRMPVVLDGGFVPDAASASRSPGHPRPPENALLPLIAADGAAGDFPEVKGGGQVIYPWGSNTSLSYRPSLQAVGAPVYPLLARYEHQIVPSLPFEVVRRYFEIDGSQVRIIEGGGVLLGPERVVPLNVRAELLPALGEGRNAIKVISALELMTGGVGLEALRGRIVLLGDGQAGAGLGPPGAHPASTEFSAAVVSNLLTQAGYVQPLWEAGLAAFLALVFFLGVLVASFTLPGFLVGLLAVGLALLYPLLSFLVFRTAGWWLPPELPILGVMSAWLPSVLLVLRPSHSPLPPSSGPIAPMSIPTPIPVLHPTPVPAWSPTPTPIPTATSSAPEASAPSLPKKPTSQPVEAKERITSLSMELGDDRPQIIRDESGHIIQLGKYRLVRKIATGGGGAVFEGLDTSMGRKVAVKTLLQDADLRFSRMQDRFTNEARAAGSLNHPYINTVYDFGRIKDVTYLVLEYLEGRTLAQWMRENPLPEPRSLLTWLEQICDALDYAHGKQIIHRDIKPGNLMLVQEDKVIKLLDFGIAKVEDMMLTQAGVAVGTPVYMSPEQFTGEKVSSASDQYGLSVVIYQLLSHKLPYAGARIPEICNHIVKNELIPLTEQNSSIPLWFWESLKKGMSLKAADRYGSCTELYLALKACV